MKYILLFISITGGLLSFNAYSAVVANCSASAPSVTGAYSFYRSGNFTHTNIEGCDYVLPENAPLPVYTPLPDGSSGMYFNYTWYPTGNKARPDVKVGPQPSDNMDHSLDKQTDQLKRYCAQSGTCDKDGFPLDAADWRKFQDKDNASSGKPSGNTDDSGSTSGDATSPGKPDNTPSTPVITPPAVPSEPDFSIPDNADYAQLNKLYFSCVGQNNNYRNPHDSRYNPALDVAYNAHVDKCNAVYDKINDSFPVGGKFTLNKSSDEFLTKRFDGTMVHCSYQPHIGSDMGGQVLSKSARRDVIQHPDFPVYDPHNYPLNFNYPAAQPRWVDTLCETVADRPDSVNDLYNGKGSDNKFDNPGTDTGSVGGKNPPEGITDSGTVTPPGVTNGMGGGSGTGSTDKNDNGDVVAAIDAFHADANKNHEETMKALDASGADIDSIKGGLSSDINKLIGDTKNEMTNSYNEAMGEIKSVFGDIDAYIPDIKLSFDLPAQFTAGILGRCVPLVFDFNISLVGLEPYHFHAEGIQACRLYDDYIRSVVEYMLYFITALACRRVFTRAAEFLTSQG
ncbi:hypothetical protein ABN789_005203 [Salmonella enterica]